jgi:hypothetical protein
MKRLPEIQEDSAQDSFLDVIANLVGVIIILVMLVGAKATRDVMIGKGQPTAPTASTPHISHATGDKRLQEELNAARSAALKSRSALEQAATQLVRIRQESTDFDAQRVTLAMHRSIVEEDIERRRNALDAEKQREFDVQRKIAEAQLKLDQLTQQQMGLLSGPETVEELESMPTPLAREIDEDAIHLRVKNGLVSVVPVTELMAEATSHLDEFHRRLQSSDQVVDTFGPISGYRVRVQVSRQVDPSSAGGPRAGQVQRVYFDPLIEVIPTSEAIGQDVKSSLMPGGAVYQYLQSHRRVSPAVVLWMYTDSFDDFQIIKRTLWEMGFSLATRPLMPGSEIGFSPHGSKAAVQ